MSYWLHESEKVMVLDKMKKDIDVFLHLVQNHYFFGLVQPVGLVDYESLKKSI